MAGGIASAYYGVPDKIIEEVATYLPQDIIDIVNEYGKNRGKFKKGSNKNPVTGTGGKQKAEEPAEEPKEEHKKDTEETEEEES